MNIPLGLLGSYSPPLAAGNFIFVQEFRTTAKHSPVSAVNFVQRLKNPRCGSLLSVRENDLERQYG